MKTLTSNNMLILTVMCLILLPACKRKVQVQTLTKEVSVNNAVSWDLTTAFPTDQSVSSVTNAPGATQICNTDTGGQNVLGVVGLGICQRASGGTNATAADVLAGTYFWDSTGTSIQGTLVITSPSFATLTPSYMYRDIATTQMTLATEKTSSSYVSGYREIPDVNIDDEGYNSSTITRAVRPSNACGTTQNSIAARIADCSTQNGADAIWSGATKSNSGEGEWKLVTKASTGEEVWRDERTGLLWSDRFSGKTWCPAAGSTQMDGNCDANTQSICVENGTLIPAIAGEDWTTGVYDNVKGSMGAIATSTSPTVRWRLPTKNDFMQADLDGMRYVLPNMSNTIWTSTAISDYRTNAWVFDPRYGVLIRGGGRGGDTEEVRCLGR
ncbi:MAG: hypothetical protein KBD76_04100 [Bacteriovorax sp.]|nr:hypothetical protein [Bacteriovorax sp.]